MKIYTGVVTNKEGSFIGVELLNDQNQTYMLKAFKAELQAENSAHVLGIKRAMSFIKNNNLMYADEDITVYTPLESKYYFPKSVEERIYDDEYIQSALKKGQSIKHNREGLTEDDKYHLMCADTQARLEVRRNNMTIASNLKNQGRE